MKFVIALLLAASTSAIRLTKTDIRGPTVDGPTAGVCNSTNCSAPVTIPNHESPAPAAAKKAALAQKNDIRGPTTDGPTAGVCNSTHCADPAPIPGPFVATPAAKKAALAQQGDIRGPTTDGPTAGVCNGVNCSAPITIPQHVSPAPAAAKALQLEGDVLATGAADYGSHAVLDDTLHADRKLKIQSVAGPDVTDQIGASVHASAMEGGEPMPGDKRDNIIGPAPKSFAPKYGVSTTRDAGDIAAEASAAAGKAINAAAAAKAEEEAKVAAQLAKEAEAQAAADLAALKASAPSTAAGKEAKAAKLAAAEGAIAAKQDEKAKESADAVTPTDGTEKPVTAAEATAGAK